MNQKLRTMSLSLAVACATSAAYAADRVVIYQDAPNGSIAIEQVGNTGENMAHVQQSGGYDQYSSAGQSAVIQQASVDGANALIMQSGSYNDFRISQRDGGNMTAEIYGGGEGNRASIDQTGFGMVAYVDSYGLNNLANITQVGYGEGGNFAKIIQYGSDNVASITQVGSNHYAQITQNNAYGGPPSNLSIVQRN